MPPDETITSKKEFPFTRDTWTHQFQPINDHPQTASSSGVWLNRESWPPGTILSLRSAIHCACAVASSCNNTRPYSLPVPVFCHVSRNYQCLLLKIFWFQNKSSALSQTLETRIINPSLKRNVWKLLLRCLKWIKLNYNFVALVWCIWAKRYACNCFKMCSCNVFSPV